MTGPGYYIHGALVFSDVEVFNLHSLVFQLTGGYAVQLLGKVNPTALTYQTTYVTNEVVRAYSNMAKLEEFQVEGSTWTATERFASSTVQRLTLNMNGDHSLLRTFEVLPAPVHLKTVNRYAKDIDAPRVTEDPIPGPFTTFSALKTFTSQETTFWYGEYGVQMSFRDFELLLEKSPGPRCPRGLRY